MENCWRRTQYTFTDNLIHIASGSQREKQITYKKTALNRCVIFILNNFLTLFQLLTDQALRKKPCWRHREIKSRHHE